MKEGLRRHADFKLLRARKGKSKDGANRNMASDQHGVRHRRMHALSACLPKCRAKWEIMEEISARGLIRENARSDGSSKEQKIDKSIDDNGFLIRQRRMRSAVSHEMRAKTWALLISVC